MGNDFSLAWRVLDAQYWGVPQRRERIYLVADFRGGSAGKILFESEGVSRNFEQSEIKGQETTGGFRDGIEKTSSLVFENHAQDCRYKGPLETMQTVSATFGTGGNNQPFVLETLKPIVYGICAKDSNSMKSSNPNSGIYEAETVRTLDANGGSPCNNQGGMAVVCLQGSMIGRNIENGPNGSGINDDVSFTLNTVDKHAVVYAMDRASFNCGSGFVRKPGITDDGINSTLTAQGPSAVVYSSGKASFFTSAVKDKSVTLVATDYKDPPLINDNYIVRRLTPTECAKLQGFPSWWCSNLETEEPTDDEITFWKYVFETHRKIMGKTRGKTEKQIIKWLKNPHSDSAEYKMWGNGVCLPIVIFVLSGIVWASSLDMEE